MNNLSVQQKVRNRPIQITDIAIAKIVCRRFEGLTDIQNKNIQDWHKALLTITKQYCEKMQNLYMECAAVANIKTGEIHFIRGKNGHVNISTDGDLSARIFFQRACPYSLIYMHNHPSTGTFSAVDLNTFAANNTFLIMTALGNDGCLYSLQKKPYDNGINNMVIKYNELFDNYRKTEKFPATKAVKEVLAMAGNYGVIYVKGARKK